MNNKEIVLISGGSGMIGSKLSSTFQRLGYEVRILTRNEKKASSDPLFFYWDIDKYNLDENCLTGVNHLFNLSGASVGTNLWTKSRKAELIKSRVTGTKLLHDKIVENGIKLTTYFGASAVGYYGGQTATLAHVEDEGPGSDFLANLCVQWENEHQQFKDYCKNLYIGRISNVISSEGGFIQPFRMLSQLKLRICLGKGDQMVSWIHLADLVKIMTNSINIDKAGTYNLSAGSLSWKELQGMIYNGLGRQWITLTMPDVLLKITMGEMSSLILGSSHVSNKKLLQLSLIENLISKEEAMSKII